MVSSSISNIFCVVGGKLYRLLSVKRSCKIFNSVVRFMSLSYRSEAYLLQAWMWRAMMILQMYCSGSFFTILEALVVKERHLVNSYEICPRMNCLHPIFV